VDGYVLNVLKIIFILKDAKVGIIEDRVRQAFEKLTEEQNLYEFAIEMAHIGDYSVRSSHNWGVLVNSVYKIQKENVAKLKGKSNEMRKKRSKNKTSVR
jgi:hypothetical protein